MNNQLSQAFEPFHIYCDLKVALNSKLKWYKGHFNSSRGYRYHKIFNHFYSTGSEHCHTCCMTLVLPYSRVP